MKLAKLTAAFAVAVLSSVAAFAAPLCPATAYTVAGCNSILTFNADGTISVTAGAAPNTPYDGSDDNLVGVINNSGATVNSVVLTGSGNGGGLFAFDGDGINYVLGVAYNPHDPTGYGGPDSYYSNISTDTTTGTVNFFGGLANGSTTYFSLESSFASAPPTPGGQTPEPGTLVLLGTGALGVAGTLRRRLFN